MKLGNAVDREAGDQAEICHPHLAVSDDRHIRDLSAFGRELFKGFLAEPAVDLLDDAGDAGKMLAEQVEIPLFQRLAHYGMVGVGPVSYTHLRDFSNEKGFNFFVNFLLLNKK